MRAISDVVFLKMFLICKPRLLIFYNFQKLRKHNIPTGTRNQVSKSTSILRNECKINAPSLMRGNEINSGFCETIFRATEFYTIFIKYSSGKMYDFKIKYTCHVIFYEEKYVFKAIKIIHIWNMHIMTTNY